MGRGRRVYLYFMERYFNDLDHLGLFMEANHLGFKNSGAFAEFGFTREEFESAYAARRTRLPSGERIEWHSLNKTTVVKIKQLGRTPYGYQLNRKTILNDRALNFIFNAPFSTFEKLIPAWICTGVEWGTKVLIVYRDKLLLNWIHKYWTDEYALQFECSKESLYKLFRNDTSHRTYGWVYNLVDVYRIPK